MKYIFVLGVFICLPLAGAKKTDFQSTTEQCDYAHQDTDFTVNSYAELLAQVRRGDYRSGKKQKRKRSKRRSGGSSTGQR